MIVVNGVGVLLTPEEKLHMAVTLSVGHKLNISIVFLDQNGNPMKSDPTLDAVPQWSNTTPATETLAVDASSLTATATSVVAGTDTVNVSLTVAGNVFQTALDVTVEEAPQVLTSIALNAEVV